MKGAVPIATIPTNACRQPQQTPTDATFQSHSHTKAHEQQTMQIITAQKQPAAAAAAAHSHPPSHPSYQLTISKLPHNSPRPAVFAGSQLSKLLRTDCTMLCQQHTSCCLAQHTAALVQLLNT